MNRGVHQNVTPANPGIGDDDVRRLFGWVHVLVLLVAGFGVGLAYEAKRLNDRVGALIEQLETNQSLSPAGRG